MGDGMRVATDIFVCSKDDVGMFHLNTQRDNEMRARRADAEHLRREAHRLRVRWERIKANAT